MSKTWSSISVASALISIVRCPVNLIRTQSPTRRDPCSPVTSKIIFTLTCTILIHGVCLIWSQYILSAGEAFFFTRSNQGFRSFDCIARIAHEFTFSCLSPIFVWIVWWSNLDTYNLIVLIWLMLKFAQKRKKDGSAMPCSCNYYRFGKLQIIPLLSNNWTYFLNFYEL